MVALRPVMSNKMDRMVESLVTHSLALAGVATLVSALLMLAGVR